MAFFVALSYFFRFCALFFRGFSLPLSTSLLGREASFIMVLQNDKAMKNRMCGLLVAFFTGILLYGQASYAYVLATEEEVAAGGEFIFASHADLTEAYVAKGFSSSGTYIETTQKTEEYGLIKLGAKRTTGYQIMSLGGISVGHTVAKGAGSISPNGTKTLWKTSLSPTSRIGLFRVANEEYATKNSRRLQFYKNSETDVRVANYTVNPETPGYFDGDIYIFKRVEGTPVTVSASGYATLYREEAFQMPAGLTGGIITGKESVADAESEATYTLNYDWRYTPGTVVPGGAALIIKGEAGKYVLAPAESAEAAPADNLLHGTVDENGMTHCGGDAEYYYYKLAYGNDGTTLGFWWGVEGGGPFACAAGKAYLAIPRALAASVRGFSLPETVSGMPCISSNARQTQVYDLSGRALPVRGDGTLPQLPRGIYIVGGKKVWVK